MNKTISVTLEQIGEAEGALIKRVEESINALRTGLRYESGTISKLQSDAAALRVMRTYLEGKQ